MALLLLTTGVVRLAGLSPTVIEVADTVACVSGLGFLRLAIGVAVTRYRLFEIDRLISLTDDLLDVVATTLQPTRASVWMR